MSVKFDVMNIQKIINKAQELVKRGKLDDGIDLLNEVIGKFPKQPCALSMLGMLYIHKKKTNLAKKCLEKSLKIIFDPVTAENLIVLLVQEKNWQEAYSWSKKLLEKNNNVMNSINHAMILREIGCIRESLNFYQTTMDKYPSNIAAKISYGFTLNKIEQFDKAIEVYQQGLLKDSKNYALLYNLGVSYLNIYDYDSAIKYFKLALIQSTSSSELWLTMAACQLKKRDYESAIQSINQAEKIQPDNPNVPFQMATILVQQNKNKEALEYFNKALDIDENHIESKYQIGLMKLKEEKFHEAMNYYKYRTVRKINRIGKFNDLNQPILDKETDLIISWEQGIGDQILLLSLIPEIKFLVKSIIYISQDKIYILVKENYPEIKVIKESESYEFLKGNPNYQKINIGSIMGYINDWNLFFKKFHIWRKVDQKLKKQYENKYKPKNELLMGISWMSANKKIGDEKTIPLNEFTELIVDKHVISLQYGDVQDEILEINSKERCNIMHDEDLDYYDDLNGLFALVSICDFVITCSNVTAHIAGRLGIKTYLITPKNFGNIWYWNADNEGFSKWYPSVQIFRQTTDGAWSKEIKKIKDLLTS